MTVPADAPTSLPLRPASRKPRRLRPLRWLRWGLVLALLLELGLRQILGLGKTLLYQQDPACGYVARPNQHLVRVFALIATNEQGMRCPPVPATKAPDEFRLIFVGDSVTYGTMWVDQSQIFTSMLQQDLPARLRRPVRVLNASTGGWAIGNELGFLRSRGTFDSDLVVMVVNTFDLLQEFNDAQVGVDPTLPDRDYPIAEWEVWKRFVQPHLRHMVISDRGTTMLLANSRELALSRLAELEETRKVVAARGARFAIVYSPFVGSDGRPFAIYQPFLQAVRNWAVTANVPVLDLSAAYATSPASKVFYDGMHLRAAGHAIAANAIENWPALTNPLTVPTTNP